MNSEKKLEEKASVDIDDTDCESVKNIDAKTSATIETPLSTSESSNDNPLSSSSPLVNVRKYLRRVFILEPPVFLIYLAIYLSSTVYQNQLLYYSCTNVYHHSPAECKPLLGIETVTDEAKIIEDEVQPYAASILMVRSLVESIIPAILSLFIGPWSDKFGRRFILLTTFTGFLIGYIILTIISVIATATVVSPWLYVLSSVPSVLCGGRCALVTVVYCYISDVAKEKTALRMLLMEVSLAAGIGGGNVFSGYLYVASSAVVVFTVSSCLMLVALLYLLLVVPESLKPDQIQTGSKIREFFRWELVVDLVKVAIKKRPNCDRAFIWLTMITITLVQFTTEGDTNVTYLFFRKQFEWTLKDFSTFNMVAIGIQILGCVLGMIVLRRLLKLSILTMTLISLACSVMESTVRACAAYWWEIYLGLALGFMRGITTPMARAILAHVVPITEIGKIFALTTSLATISPLVAAPLYTSVYGDTLSFYPGLFNIISAALYLLDFIFIAIIYGVRRSFAHTTIYQAIGS